MTAEDFQILDDTTINDSTIKRSFVKINLQHGAQVNDENKLKNLFSRKSHFSINW